MNIFEALHITNHKQPLNIGNGHFYAYDNILVNNITRKLLYVDFTPITTNNTICQQLGINTPAVGDSLDGTPFEIINKDGVKLYHEYHPNLVDHINHNIIGVNPNRNLFIKILNELNQPISVQYIQDPQPNKENYNIIIKYIYYPINDMVLKQRITYDLKTKKPKFNSAVFKLSEFKDKHYNHIYNN